jgi:hypothetical protein
MSDRYVLDADKNPVPEPDLRRWAEAFETMDRRVAYTEVGPWRVSTVFLGLDHSFGGRPPLLFETLVFPEGSYIEDDGDRCSTWTEAEAMHERFAEQYREKLS